MTKQRRNMLSGILITAVILFLVGFVIGGLGQPPPGSKVVANMYFELLRFLLMFLGVILAFIDAIILLATRLNHRIAESLYRPVERILIAAILVGAVGMIQRLNLDLYKFSFLVMFVGTIGYIIWSHLVPRTAGES